jgi:hypothetical protein
MKDALRVAALAAAVSLVAASSSGAYTPGSDVVAFVDGCKQRLYAMNADGSGRRLLADVRSATLLDVSRDLGPTTVLAVGRSDVSSASSPLTLYAIDPDGLQAPVDLLGAGDPDPAAYGAFSPDGGRIAYVHHVRGADGILTGVELYVGDVVRDASSEVTGLRNITRVADVWQIGQRSDSNARGPFTGQLDFTRRGDSIVIVIYDDLWQLRLAGDGHTLVDATPLTRTTDFAELFPSASPVADVAAFAGGPFSDRSGFPALMTDDVNVYTLDLASGARRPVTTSKKGGSAGNDRNRPVWSPDGTSLVFSAQGSSAFGKRNLECGGYVNYDLFRIPADGSAKAVNLTNTAGTGVESHPQWGWQ